MEVTIKKNDVQNEDSYEWFLKGYQAAFNKVLRCLRDKNYTCGSSAKEPEEWAIELEHFFKDDLHV